MTSPTRLQIELEKRRQAQLNEQLLIQRHRANGSNNNNIQLSTTATTRSSHTYDTWSPSSPYSPNGSPQSNSRNGQPLHYRTNFGKDYGYRPPSTSSPVSSPTLLTEWSSQQNLQRKKQQLLQRQRQMSNPGELNLPQLDNHNVRGGDNSTSSVDEIPFDERELRQQPQLLPPLSPGSYSPQRARMVFERETIIKNGVGYVSPSGSGGSNRSLGENNATRHVWEHNATRRCVSSPRGTQNTYLTRNNNGATPISRTNNDTLSRNFKTSPSRSITTSPLPRGMTGTSPHRNANVTPSRIRGLSPPRPYEPISPGTTGNYESKNDSSGTASPRPKKLSAAQEQQRLVNYKVPSALHVLYTSPIRMSSPKQSLSPFQADMGKTSAPIVRSSSSDQLSPNLVSAPTTNTDQQRDCNEKSDDEEESVEDENEEFDYTFEDDTYEEEGDDDDNRKSLLSRYQFPKSQVSAPRAQPLLDITASVAQKQYPIIGGPNMLTLEDEASVLTGDFGDDHTSPSLVNDSTQQPPERNTISSVNAREISSPNSRVNWKHYENLASLYGTGAKGPFAPSLTHPYGKHASTSSTATSDTSENISDTQPMIDVVGVSRYLQELTKEKEKKLLRVNPSNGAYESNVRDDTGARGISALTVQNSTSVRSDEDSLFDFIDSNATTSTDNSASPSSGQANATGYGPQQAGSNNRETSSKSPYQYSLQNRPHQNIYANRQVSLLYESTTEEDTTDASLDKQEGSLSDAPPSLEERARTAWKQRTRAAAQAAIVHMNEQQLSRMGHEKRLALSNHSSTTPSLTVSTSDDVGLNTISRSCVTDDLDSRSPGQDSVSPSKRLLFSKNTENSEDEDEYSPRRRRVEYLQRRNEQQAQQQRDEAIRNRSSSGIPNDTDASTFDPTENSATVGTYSLNSLYTKSAESEMQDAIKDVFLLGNSGGTSPGRRKVYDHVRAVEQTHQHVDDAGETDEDSEGTGPSPSPDVRRLLDHVVDDDDDDGSEEPNDVSVSISEGEKAFISNEPHQPKPPQGSLKEANSKEFSPSRRPTAVGEEKKDDDHLLGDVWSYVGRRISAVTTALGLDVGDASTVSSPNASVSGALGSPTSAATMQSSMNQMFSSPLSPESRGSEHTFSPGKMQEQGDNMTREQRQAEKQRQQSNGFSGWNILDYASDVLLGPAPLSPCNASMSTREASPAEPELGVVKKKHMDIEDDSIIDEDEQLLELANQAAISLHRINGFEFDQSEIDLSHDIKFIVADLKMPLGLIFQENDKGCWITTVLPDGSAASSGAIEAGDQLAAVDGASAINMTVDEIAYLIRQHQSATVELTFLRYVGRFRPQAGSIIDEEGYEVMAKRVESPPPSPPPVVLPKNNLEEESHSNKGSAREPASRSCIPLMQKRQGKGGDGNANSAGKKSKTLLPSFRNKAPPKKDDSSLSWKSMGPMSQEASYANTMNSNDVSPKKKRGFPFFGNRKK